MKFVQNMTDDEIIVKFEQLATILKQRALFAYRTNEIKK